MKRMKLCFVGNAQSVHVKRWVRWFARRGHDVHLITPRFAELDDVDIYQIGSGKQGSIINFFRKMVETRRLVREIQPDILHAHYAFGYGTFAAFANYHPFLVNVWGSDVLREPDESIVKKFVIGRTLHKADVVPVTAKFMVSYLDREFGVQQNKIERIPWGIELDIFMQGYDAQVDKLRDTLKIADDAPVVISPRGMHPKYEIDIIVESIPQVTEQHPKATFIFLRGTGSKEYESQMKAKVHNLGVADSTIFIEKFLSPQEMAVYLNLSDVMLSVPKTDQFGRCIWEAMACKTIPVLSDIDGYKQYLTDENALYVEDVISELIAKKIIYAIENSHLKTKFYERNMKLIKEDFDWYTNAKKMERLYMDIVTSGD